MKIGVLGGTGTGGSAAVRELLERGHDVRVLSRGTGFDVTAPEASPGKLDGLEVLVDCLQPSKTSAKAARAVLVDGLGRTLNAAAAAGVGHVVSLSIVGIDGLPFSYYRIKLEQEVLVRSGPVPGTVVRATQFPALFDQAWGATKPLGTIPAPRGLVAPIAPDDMAVALVDAVEAGPGGGDRQIRGAEIVDLRQVASDWKRARGSRRPVVPLPAVGGALKAVAAGDLVDEAIPAAPRGWSDLISPAPAVSR